jgi:hypothetical protein
LSIGARPSEGSLSSTCFARFLRKLEEPRRTSLVHTIPYGKIQYGKICRHFNPTWFTEYANWLEYNILEDVACCLYCYLFKPNTEHQAGGNSFVTEGFKNWKKKKKKLHNHVGAHNIALAIFFLIILIKFLLTIVFFF